MKKLNRTICLFLLFPLLALAIPSQAKTQSLFSYDEIRTGNFVNIKHQEWSACHRQKNRPPFFELSLDNLPRFLQKPVTWDHLSQMESQKLTEGKVAKQPWSGDYWAIARGILGARMFEPGFNSVFEWKARYDYVQNNPAEKILANGSANTLSPSEKYDLLVGDESAALTEAMWLQGKAYFDQDGKVESWMGICHGWAPAAIMEERPAKTVHLKSFDGKTELRLFPSETKGLVSYNWANNYYPEVTLGERCNKKEPKRDSNGRMIDPECNDLNPATWHLAIVNQVGVAKKSFVMDASYDYEVWNQPILSYSYSYFHPETKKPSTQLAAALVPIEEFSTDPFKKYRPSTARFLVGIQMKVSYVGESFPTENETDSQVSDNISSVTYEYDLELDANGKIIGGEWANIPHPDFIWRPLNGAQPKTSMDLSLSSSDWTDNGPIPATWNEAALQSRYRILNTVVKAIVERSSIR